MKVLVVGNGGRESAIINKLQNDAVDIYQFPYNSSLDGVYSYGDGDVIKTANELKKGDFDLVVVGPEKPLVDGFTDILRSKGIPVFGCSQKASRLEGSKEYAKEFMRRYSIPTASFEIADSVEKGMGICSDMGFPLYIKADGLAAGKGAVFVPDPENAHRVLDEIFTNKVFGDQRSCVIEQYLDGFEISMLSFISNGRYYLLPPAMDYKKAFDGGLGPNTGGMGAISSMNLIDIVTYRKWAEELFSKVIYGLERENVKYNGILYAGLMVSQHRPYVLEFNCRFGDPETQSILPIIDCDLYDVMNSVAHNTTVNYDIKKDLFSVSVVLAARGYPASYEKDIPIDTSKLDVSQCNLIPAGMKRTENGLLFSTGGRILCINAVDENREMARKKTYDNIEKLLNERTFYRKDIGSL